MATFIEAVSHWATLIAERKHAAVAIVCKSDRLLGYAVAGSAATNGYDHRTAAVNALQSMHGDTPNLLALSYAPTAACIGMATLLGIKRIVWKENDVQHSLTLTPGGPVHFPGGAQAVVFQASKVEYEKKQPLPPDWERLRETHPIPIRPHQFAMPPGTDDLVSGLLGPDDVVRDNMCMQLVFAIAAAAHGPLTPTPGNPSRRRPAHDGQNVASVLVDSHYRLIAWAINTNKAHSSLHGEINMVRGYQRLSNAALPAGGKLFTTLEPCIMCSGMLVHAAGPNQFTIVSGQEDLQVQWSALRRDRNVDGRTGAVRNVHHEVARTPLTLNALDNARAVANASANARPVVTNNANSGVKFNFNWHMTQAQWANSESGKLTPTTRFLESRVGKTYMSDAMRQLNMQAALWLTADLRPAWREKLAKFIQHVETVV